ncbi:pyruvate kinase alpha/beta domain-containing protein, partial [Methanospirillum sp.]
ILNERSDWHERNVEGIISYRACYIAEELESPAIVAFTRSGLTAERVSRCRPRAPVLALTPDPAVARRLLLRWGILPVVSDPIQSADELFRAAVKIARSTGIARSGEQLVIIAGNFSGKEGRTNMIKVEEIP